MAALAPKQLIECVVDEFVSSEQQPPKLVCQSAKVAEHLATIAILRASYIWCDVVG